MCLHYAVRQLWRQQIWRPTVVGCLGELLIWYIFIIAVCNTVNASDLHNNKWMPIFRRWHCCLCVCGGYGGWGMYILLLRGHFHCNTVDTHHNIIYRCAICILPRQQGCWWTAGAVLTLAELRAGSSGIASASGWVSHRFVHCLA